MNSPLYVRLVQESLQILKHAIKCKSTLHKPDIKALNLILLDNVCRMKKIKITSHFQIITSQ